MRAAQIAFLPGVRLDLARERTAAAVKAYRREQLAAARGMPHSLRATLAELRQRSVALAAELDRLGALACPTLEAAVPLAATFRAARVTLEEADRLTRRSRPRRRWHGVRPVGHAPL